jgi:hypothetical protein
VVGSVMCLRDRSDALGGLDLFFSGALLVRLQIPPIDGAKTLKFLFAIGPIRESHIDIRHHQTHSWNATDSWQLERTRTLAKLQVNIT